MKKLWSTIKTIIYTYLVQYLLIFIGIVSYIALTKDVDIIMDQNKIYTFTIIGVSISLIPISLYLYRKYKIKESKIKLKKLLPMIPLGLSISLFYNMLTINLQPTDNLLDLNIILLIGYIVILAPIYEELLFRYISLRIAKEHYKETTAIIIISTIFALMHSGIINIIYAFIIGIVLSKVYIKSFFIKLGIKYLNHK